MWFTLAIISTVIFSFYGILTTVISFNSKDPRIASIAFNLICGIISLGIGAFEIHRIESIPLYGYLLIILGIAVYTVFSRYEFLSASENDTSVRSIFQPIVPLITTILAVFVYNEAITTQKIIGIVLIILSNTIAFIRFKDRKTITTKGFIYMLLTYIPLGIAWSIDKTAGILLPISLYLSITYIAPALINMFLLKYSIKEVISEINISKGKIYLLSILQVVGYYLFVLAFTLGESSKVSFIQSIGGILTILLGIVILKEGEDLWIKIIAGIVAVGGILLLKG